VPHFYAWALAAEGLDRWAVQIVAAAAAVDVGKKEDRIGKEVELQQAVRPPEVRPPAGR
jgi:hypothetical protein